MINTLNSLIQKRNELEISRVKEQEDFQKTFENEIEKAFKKKFPKRKFSMQSSFKNNQPEHGEIFNTFNQEAKKIYDRQIEEYQDIKEKIHDLCDKINEIPKADEWILVDTIYRGAYRSMGWSEFKYSKFAAQQIVDLAECFGLEAKMELEGELYIHVYAKTTNAGREILVSKPFRSLKEWMKACWNSGVNPRVYNPFLPNDLEEKIGIDHFGRDIVGKDIKE